MADIGKLSDVLQPRSIKPVKSIVKKKTKNNKQLNKNDRDNLLDDNDDENQHIDEYV